MLCGIVFIAHPNQEIELSVKFKTINLQNLVVVY